MVGSVISYLSIGLYYYKKVDSPLYYTVIYYTFRNALRMIDLENTRPQMSIEEWQTLCILQIIGTALNIHILSKCFPSNIIHKSIVGLMIIYYAFTILCGILGYEKVISDSPSKIFYQMLFATIMFIYQQISVISFNKEYLDEVQVKLTNEKEYKFILDRLEYSIIIIEKNQIEFVNDKFLTQFHGLIQQYSDHRIRENDSSETTKSKSFFSTLCNYIKKNFTSSENYESQNVEMKNQFLDFEILESFKQKFQRIELDENKSQNQVNERYDL